MEPNTHLSTENRALRAVLGKCRVFQGAHEIELATLAGLAIVQEYEEGDLIIKQGSAGDAYYVIYDGAAEVSKRDRGGQEVVITTMGPTDVFGEIALAMKRPRTATVNISADALLLRYTFQDYEKLQQFMPELAKKIMDNMRKIMTERNWSM